MLLDACIIVSALSIPQITERSPTTARFPYKMLGDEANFEIKQESLLNEEEDLEYSPMASSSSDDEDDQLEEVSEEEEVS